MIATLALLIAGLALCVTLLAGIAYNLHRRLRHLEHQLLIILAPDMSE